MGFLQLSFKSKMRTLEFWFNNVIYPSMLKPIFMSTMKQCPYNINLDTWQIMDPLLKMCKLFIRRPIKLFYDF